MVEMSIPVDAFGTRRYTRNSTSSHRAQVGRASSIHILDENSDQDAVTEQV